MEVFLLSTEGNHIRDFTYIDDIVEPILRLIKKPPKGNNKKNKSRDPSESAAPYKIYNIGNNNPCTLLRFIEVLEDCLGKKAIKNMLPLQPGDVPYTYADTDDLMKDVGYRPGTKVEDGIAKFVAWYKSYYEIK